MLTWTIPPSVLAAAAIFLAVNLAGVIGLRGVADPEGYILNSSRMIPVNTHEDDGHLNITAMLGHLNLHQNKFSYYFNIGGPFLLLAQGAAAVGDALGLVKRFDDPTLYWLYPEELRAAWRFFGYLKLAFLVWLPLAVYWFCSNHLTTRTGVLATWLVTAMPFIPGFEQRMKVDSVTILLGLLSLIFLVAFARWGKRRHLYSGAALLSVSLSMKFVMLPCVAVMAGCCLYGARTRGLSVLSRPFLATLAKTAAVFLLVFFASNPRFIPGLLAMTRDYASHISVSHSVRTSYGFWETISWRLANLEPLIGPWSTLVGMPALVLAVPAGLRGSWRPGILALAAFFVLDVLYLYTFIGADGVRTITYYFFAASVVLCMLTAFALDRLAAWLSGANRIAGIAALALAGAMIFSSFLAQANVLSYILGPSNRQEALAWIGSNVPVGSSLGVPMPPGGPPLNSLYWPDPMRLNVYRVGESLEDLGRIRPDYVLRVFSPQGGASPLPRSYEQVALFDRGQGLSGADNRDMFQDEAYQVLRRVGHGPGPAPTLEHSLFMRIEKDPDQNFNLMAWKATTLYPISLEMFRKAGNAVLPFPIQGFTTSLRQGDAVQYLHQIPPECLTLWGVKYLVAGTEAASPMREQVLDSGLYALEAAPDWPLFTGQPVLLENTAYLGQAVFIPDMHPAVSLRSLPSVLLPWKGRLPLSGDLPLSDGQEYTLLEIALEMETDNSLDLRITGGPRVQSLVMGPGFHRVRVPYRAGPRGARYEFNPVKGEAKAVLHSISALPMTLVGHPAVRTSTLTPRLATAVSEAPSPGRVSFALPWHRYWRAEVDGRHVPVLKGPGNTVAVPVQAGRHQISLLFGK